MTRAELLRALVEILAAGPAAAEVIVLVRLPARPGVYPESLGAFGEVGSRDAAVAMLMGVAGWVDRAGAMIDSAETILATLRLPDPGAAENYDEDEAEGLRE